MNDLENALFLIRRDFLHDIEVWMPARTWWDENFSAAIQSTVFFIRRVEGCSATNIRERERLIGESSLAWGVELELLRMGVAAGYMYDAAYQTLLRSKDSWDDLFRL